MTQTGRQGAHAAPCAAKAATLDRHGVLGVQQEQRVHGLTLPNVRGKPAPTVGRQARATENVHGTCGPGLVARRWGSA